MPKVIKSESMTNCKKNCYAQERIKTILKQQINEVHAINVKYKKNNFFYLNLGTIN
jgi:hypothetical protein